MCACVCERQTECAGMYNCFCVRVTVCKTVCVQLPFCVMRLSLCWCGDRPISNVSGWNCGHDGEGLAWVGATCTRSVSVVLVLDNWGRVGRKGPLELCPCSGMCVGMEEAT